MVFEIISIGYSRDKTQMLKYRDEIVNCGILVLPQKDSCASACSSIEVEINSAQDFVKLTDTVGNIIFDGEVIRIYDDYYE